MYLYLFLLLFTLYCIVKYCIALPHHIVVFFSVLFCIFLCFLPLLRINVFIIHSFSDLGQYSVCHLTALISTGRRKTPQYARDISHKPNYQDWSHACWIFDIPRHFWMTTQYMRNQFFASWKNDEMFCPIFLLGITLRKAVYPVFYSGYVANPDKCGEVTTANMLQDK